MSLPKTAAAWFVLLLVGSMLTGCQSGGGNGSDGATDTERRFRVTLREFNPAVLNGYEQCSELGADIDEAGQLLANLIIEGNRDRGWGPEPGPAWDDVGSGGEEPTLEPGEGVAGDEQNGSGPDPEGYQTNTQVEGVDEADIVKSDGRYIYTAYGNELLVHDLTGAVRDRVAIPETSQEVLEEVLAGFRTPRGTADLPFVSPPSDNISGLLLNDGRVAALVSGYAFLGEPVIGEYTRILAYQVDAEGKLDLLDESLVAGSYRAAREREGTAYVVTLATLNHSLLTSPLYRFQSQYQGMNDDEYEATAFQAAQEALPEWRDAVMRALLATPEGEIPEDACGHIVQVSTMRSGSSGESEGDPDLTDGSGVLNAFAQVLSFDIGDGLSGKTVAGAFVPTYGVVTYANEDTLILGGSGWSWFGASAWENSTFLMAFSLESKRAVPTAIGSVPGTILNQFSMDVHNGHLRVASTVEARWERTSLGVWQPSIPAESVVTVLRLDPNQMETVGEVRGLGVDERLFAARFMGERGYLVTFRQVDPFYTLDLSDPSAPRVVGELEIPGFSNYLHPVGDDTILAVGQDVDPDTGWQQGLQVALFDVSDPANPLQLHKHVVEGWSSSGAQNDHRAFRYLTSRNTLILPLSSYSPGDGASFDGFQLYEVSAVGGIVELGRLTHGDQSDLEIGCYSPAYVPPRSLVFGEQLVTLKGHSVSSHDLVTLESQWQSELDEEGGGGDFCYPWFFIEDDVFLDEPAMAEGTGD